MNEALIIESIVRRVCREIPHGRAACKREPTNHAMMRLLEVGDGNHLEIGVLFGATLIMAALVKDAFGLKGECIGVDPLDGYYPPSPTHPDPVYDRKLGIAHIPLDPHAGIPINRENVELNAAYFGVTHRIRIIQAFSSPWPEELKNIELASAYIDGDHWGDMPYIDFCNVAPRVRVGGIVWFDDWKWPSMSVKDCVQKAALAPGWEEYLPHSEQHFYMKRKA